MESTIQVLALEPRIRGRSVPYREWAAERTSPALRQLCSVVVWCPGHVCLTGGAQLLPGSAPGPYQAGLAFPILRMISRIYGG